MEVTSEDLLWPVEKMADYFANGVAGFHFVGDDCSKCSKTVNVPNGAGWFCPCGAYNVLSFSANRFPFDSPDYGPTDASIRDAFEKAKQMNPKRFAWLTRRHFAGKPAV